MGPGRIQALSRFVNDFGRDGVLANHSRTAPNDQVAMPSAGTEIRAAHVRMPPDRPIDTDGEPSFRRDRMTTKATARRAGFLYLLLLVTGLLELMYFPARFIVVGDAVATLRNITADELLYRLWLLVSLTSSVVFVLVVLALEDLLRDVDRRLARRMVMLVGVSVALGMMNVVLHGAPLVLSSGATFLAPFTKPQLDALAYAFLRLHTLGTSFDMALWGLWLLPFGRLVARSGFLPRWLGHLLLVNGVAYVALAVVRLVFPAHQGLAEQLLMPFYAAGELAIIVYLVVWGAREPTRAQGVAPPA
jgi:hypothetical protein